MFFFVVYFFLSASTTLNQFSCFFFLFYFYSSGADAENSQQRGIPGERVTDDDTSLLELRPFRVYRIGEIVAYEVPLPSSAIEIDNVSGEKGVPENVSKLPAGGREKVYGKIVNIGQASEEGIRRLNVKIGATVVSVLSTEIFSFKSAREVNVSKTAANAGGLRVPAAMAALKRSMFGGSAKSTNTNGLALLGKAVPVDGTTEEEGGAGTGDVSVSNRSELLGAVNGLLARAGVPIDLEQQVCFMKIYGRCMNHNDDVNIVSALQCLILFILGNAFAHSGTGKCEETDGERVTHREVFFSGVFISVLNCTRLGGILNPWRIVNSL